MEDKEDKEVYLELCLEIGDILLKAKPYIGVKVLCTTLASLIIQQDNPEERLEVVRKFIGSAVDIALKMRENPLVDEISS